jgi:hypothetical protein
MQKANSSGAAMLATIVRWWYRGQTTDLNHQISVLQKAIARIPSAARDDCQHWLDTASRATKDHSLGYAKFDDAWSALHEIRHIFCRKLPEEDLERIAEEVAGDLVYVTDESKRKRCEADANRLQQKLHSALQKTPHSDKVIDQLRADLVTLSIIGASERQMQWHRVNLLRGRLLFTAVCLTLLSLALVTTLFWRPEYLGIVSNELHDYDLTRVFGVIAFGALGGLLSALRQQEPLAGISSLFYIERMLLYLRPVVGAVAALILYLAQLSNFVTITQTKSSALYFVVAFCAGFSEQFFLRHLSTLLQSEKKKSSSDVPKDKKKQGQA